MCSSWSWRGQDRSSGCQALQALGSQEHLVLGQVPVEAVELVQGHGVQHLVNEGDIEVVPAYIQEHASPREAWTVQYLHLSRESRRGTFAML